MRKWINRQWKRRPKPLRFLWRWAKRPDKGKNVLKRFIALREWAADREEAARKRKDWKSFRRWHGVRLAYKRKVRAKRRWLKDHRPEPPPKGAGTTMIDGRAVPNWMVPKVKEIRARGRWKGVIVSGYRTPEYSTQLCMSMCGHPTCPGRCAGRYSNHACPPSATCQVGEGAIDVSDYITFAIEASAVNAPFHNALPYDRVHFSRSGN
jgi:hypothetical protein